MPDIVFWNKSEEGVVGEIMSVDLVPLGLARFFGFMGGDTRWKKTDAENNMHQMKRLAWYLSTYPHVHLAVLRSRLRTRHHKLKFQKLPPSKCHLRRSHQAKTKKRNLAISIQNEKELNVQSDVW